MARTSVTAAAPGRPGRGPGAAWLADTLDALLRDHYEHLLRLSTCLLGERTAARRAVLEAFLSLSASPDLGGDQVALRRLRAEVIGRCRRRVVTLPAPSPDRGRPELVDLPDPGPDADAAGAAADDIASAVRALPRRQRDVVVCRFLLDMSPVDTAALLGIHQRSVDRRTHLAIAALAGTDDGTGSSEAVLREALHSYADVVVTSDEVEAARRELRARLSSVPRRSAGPSARLAVAVAATAAVAVAGTAWVALGHRSEPAAPTAGWDVCRETSEPVGEPPFVTPAEIEPGVLPTDPSRAALALSVYSHPRYGSPPGAVWLFDDGRLITVRYARVVDGRPNAGFTGYYEQRLTPRGIDCLRTNVRRFVSAPPSPAWLGGSIRLEDRTYGASRPETVANRMFDLSWLPEAAWEERDPMAYVPSEMDVCWSGSDRPAAIRAGLPAAAQALLPSSDRGRRPYGDACAVMAETNVHALVESLTEHGFRRHWPLGANPGAYVGRGVLPGIAVVAFDFWVMLPNGESGALG